MINEFDSKEFQTKNFARCQEELGKIGLTNIINAYDYIHTLRQFIPDNNEVLDNLREIVEPLEDAIRACRTHKECPHCGDDLYLSDLPQYDYVCVQCDENFYESEVK